MCLSAPTLISRQQACSLVANVLADLDAARSKCMSIDSTHNKCYCVLLLLMMLLSSTPLPLYMLLLLMVLLFLLGSSILSSSVEQMRLQRVAPELSKLNTCSALHVPC